MHTWIYMAMIFIFTSVSSSILIFLVIRFLQERLEIASTIEMQEMSRFIEPRKLLTVRLLWSLSAFAILFILQLTFGVSRMLIALPVAVCAGLAAWRLSYVWYHKKVLNRKMLFENKILDLTMGLTNGLKSGLALGQALDAVARRVGDPMKEEIATLLREVRFGLDFPTAFENLSRRLPSEDMSLLTTSILLTTRTGGSLSEVLEEMTDTIRKRKEFHDRLRSMTAQGRYEALVISLAPFAAFVIFYLIDPVLMRPLVQTGIGWCAVGLAAVLIYTGYKILLKITDVEV